MRGRRAAAVSCGSLRVLGLQAATFALVFAVAACTPIKYPPDRSEAEPSEESAVAETAAAEPAVAEADVAAAPESLPQEEASSPPEPEADASQADENDRHLADELVLAEDDSALDQDPAFTEELVAREELTLVRCPLSLSLSRSFALSVPSLSH